MRVDPREDPRLSKVPPRVVSHEDHRDEPVAQPMDDEVQGFSARLTAAPRRSSRLVAPRRRAVRIRCRKEEEEVLE